MNTLGILGIVLAFALLMFLIMRNLNLYLTVFICVAIVITFNALNPYETFKETYMTGFVGFFKNYFLLFLAGTVLAKFMDITNGARSIAQTIIKSIGKDWAFVSVPIACAILSYGGVSAHVGAFCVFAIALEIWREADLPRRALPGTLFYGVATFGMIAPGAVQIHNAVPATNLGTSYMAGAVVGFISIAFMGIAGIAYLKFWLDNAKKKGEHFIERADDDFTSEENQNLPPFILALLPLIICIALVNIKIGGNSFPVEAAVFIAALSALGLMWKYLDKSKKIQVSFQEALTTAIISVSNTCCVVGFGSVVSSTDAFQNIVQVMLNIPGPRLLSLLIGTTVICGICGSASGGLGIAVPILGPVYTQMGVAPAIVHRVMSLSSSALDSLPHNGVVVTITTGLCKETHRDSYPLTCVLSVVIPFIGSLIGVILFTLFPGLP